MVRVTLTAALLLGFYGELAAIIAVGREEPNAGTPWVVIVAIGVLAAVAAVPMVQAIWWPLDESDLGPPPADGEA